MCKMTDLGARWKRHIELPAFGETRTYWAMKYGGETRYIAEPPGYIVDETRKWLKPLYAVRVRARSV